MKNYGHLIEEKGTYVLDKIPQCGFFEYIYKNKNILFKVDQFGPAFIQNNPPVGMTVLQKKEREIFSPWKILFSVNGKTYNNFDLYNAKKFNITFKPECCIYHLVFSKFICETTFFIDSEKEAVVCNFVIKNASKDKFVIKFIDSLSLECVDTSMAVWDKKVWYMKTSFSKDLKQPCFYVEHLSVNANKDDRAKVYYCISKPVNSIEMSYERLISQTNNLSKIRSLKNSYDDVFAYDQVCSAYFEQEVEKEFSYSSLIKITKSDENLTYKNLSNYFNSAYQDLNFKKLSNDFNSITNIRRISTKDNTFNKFVNEFLPQEISWVIDLDRGWPTGMRGTRDCANDFLGYIDFDNRKTREAIVSLLKSQRFADGWFPRQIPFGNSGKYDMREFVDSGCFVMELIYEYLCSTDDYSLLDEKLPYLDSTTEEKGIEHLVKCALFYTLKENIGEHGLIKLKGGDWLDCLNKVGLKGRGETLMVTCQAVYAFKQLEDILSNYSKDYDYVIKMLHRYSKEFKQNINKYCLNDEGFYRSLFSDDGKWYFSEKDVDGEKRVYIPSNAYAIISEINTKKDKKVVDAILKNNKSPYGYKLFSKPFGINPIEGLGKMGTGDFLPLMNENGAVYNHGSHLFFLRALAKIGDYKNFYNVLNYALPYNEKFHPEKDSCSPMYAVTNCYSVAPSFAGRTVFNFLTGSISMIYRAIYNWMFGISYSMKYLKIKPCIPKQYGDSNVSIKFKNKDITIKYLGFGNKIDNVSLNNKNVISSSKEVLIDKTLLEDKNNIVIKLQ